LAVPHKINKKAALLIKRTAFDFCHFSIFHVDQLRAVAISCLFRRCLNVFCLSALCFAFSIFRLK